MDPERPQIDWTILAGYRGSQAHGTSIEPENDPEFGTDDVDLMHVVVPPPPFYLGLETYGFGQGTKEVKDGLWDIVAYDVRKFVNLLCKGNPNVLMLLWLRPEHYVYDALTTPGQLLIAARDVFTRTRATISSHIGYADGQLRGMRKDPTSRAYMGERRKALAQRFGYDVKHAAHLIRLLAMLVDLLQTGELYPDRRGRDADELIRIKRGEWPLADVLAKADDLLEQARALERISLWPERVNRTWASELSVKVIWSEWQRRGEV